MPFTGDHAKGTVVILLHDPTVPFYLDGEAQTLTHCHRFANPPHVRLTDTHDRADLGSRPIASLGLVALNEHLRSTRPSTSSSIPASQPQTWFEEREETITYFRPRGFERVANDLAVLYAYDTTSTLSVIGKDLKKTLCSFFFFSS